MYKLTFIVIFLVALGGSMLSGHQASTTQRVSETTAVCQSGMAAHNFASCYKVERQNSTEYLCNETSCWSEAK